MRRILTVMLISMALLPSSGWAWGKQGHRLVAELAQEQLTPQALGQVRALLAGESDPNLGAIANWADELRESDPQRFRATSAWHYINMGEDGCVYLPKSRCADGQCIVSALTSQAALLADPSQSLATRRDALKFVVHLTGDAHQPLHAGYAHDKGGNTVQLQFNGKGTNLHRVWDRDMLYDRHLNDAAYLDVLRPLLKTTPTLPVQHRNSASMVVAACNIDLKPALYPRGAQLERSYIEQWRPVAEQQIVSASKELAEILNAILR